MTTRPRLEAACLLFLLSPAAACAGGSSPATPIPATWTLVFADEFEPAGALDPAK